LGEPSDEPSLRSGTAQPGKANLTESYTRSPEGSTAHTRLASLAATWQARGLNPFTTCLAQLASLLSEA
jgi:hypothetical protein